MSQAHQLPDESQVKLVQQAARREKDKSLKETADNIKKTTSRETSRVLELATEKGASIWLTVLPVEGMGFHLNKMEFRDAIKLRCDWLIDDIPSTCVCGELFSVDHAMICNARDS